MTRKESGNVKSWKHDRKGALVAGLFAQQTRRRHSSSIVGWSVAATHSFILQSVPLLGVLSKLEVHMWMCSCVPRSTGAMRSASHVMMS